MKKLKKLLIALCLAIGLVAPLFGGTGLAVNCQAGYSHPKSYSEATQKLEPVLSECVKDKTGADCPSGVADSSDPTGCQPLGTNNCRSGQTADECLAQSPFDKQLNNIVNFLAAGVGIVVIAMIIVGGIQYSIAGDNQDAVGKAKTRIVNAMIALVTFIFAYAILQWLIPGGL
ncbi:MAG TPA: pilin [Candidatus Saccharimonadales bacterium]|nr:pilin [Candidatus Saccharimonadales bacterium]